MKIQGFSDYGQFKVAILNIEGLHIKCPAGYEPSRLNPLVFIRTGPECRHFTTTKQSKTCCPPVDIFYCSKKQQKTTKKECIACGGET